MQLGGSNKPKFEPRASTTGLRQSPRAIGSQIQGRGGPQRPPPTGPGASEISATGSAGYLRGQRGPRVRERYQRIAGIPTAVRVRSPNLPERPWADRVTDIEAQGVPGITAPGPMIPGFGYGGDFTSPITPYHGTPLAEPVGTGYDFTRTRGETFRPPGMAAGGAVPNTDRIPAMLSPGEFVMPKWLVDDIRAGRPPGLAQGGMVRDRNQPGYQVGGLVEDERARGLTADPAVSTLPPQSPVVAAPPPPPVAPVVRPQVTDIQVAPRPAAPIAAQTQFGLRDYEGYTQPPAGRDPGRVYGRDVDAENQEKIDNYVVHQLEPHRGSASQLADMAGIDPEDMQAWLDESGYLVLNGGEVWQTEGELKRVGHVSNFVPLSNWLRRRGEAEAETKIEEERQAREGYWKQQHQYGQDIRKAAGDRGAELQRNVAKLSARRQAQVAGAALRQTMAQAAVGPMEAGLARVTDARTQSVAAGAIEQLVGEIKAQEMQLTGDLKAIEVDMGVLGERIKESRSEEERAQAYIEQNRLMAHKQAMMAQQAELQMKIAKASEPGFLKSMIGPLITATGTILGSLVGNPAAGGLLGGLFGNWLEDGWDPVDLAKWDSFAPSDYARQMQGDS